MAPSEFSRKNLINLPNTLTYLRIASIPLIVALLMPPPSGRALNLAFILYVMASTTDYLDGILARRHNLVTSVGKLLDPLAEFMKVVENVKTNSFVHALQIESFELTPEWNKDDYSDAIVNIFTRLNTAGRTLTREEITLAWLKVG